MNFSERDYIIQWSLTVGGTALLAIGAFVLRFFQQRAQRKHLHNRNESPMTS